jgi:cell division protein ZipA
MEPQTVSATELRILIAVIGALVLVAIWFFGRPRKPGQGKRRLFARGASERIEPVFRDDGLVDSDVAETELPPESAPPRAGSRPSGDIERIVTVFVAARPDAEFTGADVVVAAEKAGLVFGDMGIFHRLVAGRPDQGPLFSMASMVKPGSFDMASLDTLRTPGLGLFMTLPGPASALDAWDTLLPTAQRLAELLDGVVLDEERNALGRQRIAHLRDELRAWDRKQESMRIRADW